MEFTIFGRQISINKALLIAIIVIAVIVLFFIGYRINQSGGKIIFEENEQESVIKNKTEDSQLKQENTASTTKPDTSPEIKVYVRGCVKNPGMVTIKKGDLIFDAVNAAGGVTDDADIENINMAFKLNENVMLKIKSKTETQIIWPQTETIKAVELEPEKAGVLIINNSGGVVVDEKSETKEAPKININTASANELDTLPGIGPSIANSIISFREKNGEYKNIKDIMKVPGIKDKLFEKISELIIVE